MKCDICGKEKNCQTWDYVVKKEVFGSVRQNTPGIDTIYKVGGKVTGIEKNTTYGKGFSKKSFNEGTAYLCIQCRIIWSIILTIIFSITISFLTFLFLKGIESLSKTTPATSIFEVLSKVFIYSILFIAIFSLTPIMKHIILAIKKSRYYRVYPWNVVSKFWK